MSERLRRTIARAIVALLLLALGLSTVGSGIVQAQQTGGAVRDIGKFAIPTVIGPNDTTTISLTLDAVPCQVDTVNVTNVALIIDRSTSMREADEAGGTPRIDAARIASGNFVESLQARDKVSVVAFSSAVIGNPDAAVVISPLQEALPNVQSIRNGINTIPTFGGTNIAAGLSVAASTLAGVPANEPRIIVLLSDGDQTDGDAAGVARDLKNQGYIIYTIGLGSPGAFDFNAALLEDIATDPTGPNEQFYYESPSTAELDDIYFTISGGLTRGGPIGVDAVWEETFDDSLFEIVPGSISDGGTVSGNTIRWEFPTLFNSAQNVTFQVRPLFNNAAHFASAGSTLTYTRGQDCERPGEQESHTQGAGGLVVVGNTAITLDSFTATATTGGIEVEWVTSAEIDTWGFHLLRSADGTLANAEQVTSEMILAEGRGQGGATYTWLDTSADPDTAYTYWLEETEIDGTTLEYGPSSWAPANPTNTRTVYVPFIQR